MRYTLPAVFLGSLLCLPVGNGFASAQQADSSSTPSAQPDNMHHMRGPMSTDDQLAHMTKALNLSSDQQTQIKPLLEGRRQQMMTLHQDQSLSREDRMAKFKTIDDDTHSKIAAVLNDDQKAKFEKMAERREQNMDRRAGSQNGAPGAPPQQ